MNKFQIFCNYCLCTMERTRQNAKKNDTSQPYREGAIIAEFMAITALTVAVSR